ncbi:MAG TPA: M50 family metallopeptidase, partial [Myxococcaceae bacterium]|nr:M50 family metallopeptidase [Myxococcaceae bacterium]
GPPLLTVRRAGTAYVLGAIPVGAFTSIDVAALRRTAGVTFAGPLANYLVALLALAVVHWNGTYVPVSMTVGTVEPASEAARARVRPGDVIITVDAQRVVDWSELVEAIGGTPGQPRTLGFLRGGEPFTATVTPQADADGIGTLGLQEQYLFQKHSPLQALARAFMHTGRITRDLAGRVVRTITGVNSKSLPPARSLMRRAAEATYGFDRYVRAVAGLSLALAAFYTLPIPPLDGGKLLLAALQAASRRQLGPKAQALLQLAGFALLLALLAGVLRAAA